MAELNLDYRGLRCPMPIVKLSQAAKSLAPGGIVRVEATDRAFRSDLDAWSRRMGFAVREFIDGEVKVAVLEKIGSS